MTQSGKRKRRAAAVSEPAGAAAKTPVWLSRAPLTAGLVALSVYLPSVAGGFLYDDEQLILRNPSIRDLGAIGTVLRYEPARPLLNLTWALNYALGGASPWHYHLVNVLIHAANAAILASLFLWMAERSERTDAKPAALLGACLFAASPMAAETVAYVASRSSALVSLFALASLRVAASVLDGAPPGRLLASMGLFVLALATKEEAAALPLLLLLVDYVFVARQELVTLKRRLWLHACFFAVVPFALAARRLATGSWLPPQAIDPGLYMLTQWAAFPLYFLRALIPIDPALYRQHAPASWPPEAATVALGLVTAVIATLAVARRRAWPAWAFAVAWLAAGLLPSSSIVSLNEMVVDHRAYLGSVGVAFALGILLWRLGGARLGMLVLALLAARSLAFEWVLRDPVRAWEHVVARAPNAPDALSALAESYSERGDPRAERLFLKLTEVAPANYRYWANLGVYYGEHGRPAEAVRALRSALERNPREASLRDYLGQILVGLGRDDEAATEFGAAIAAEPSFAPAYSNLAALRLRKGDPERARELLDSGSRFAGSAEEAEAFARLRARLP
jgi:tetratricopeptide (TPR) repeat protein